MKFDLHQSIPLTDEERWMCMKIESLLQPIEDMANSLSTNELTFELTSHSTKVEKLILTGDEDDEGVLAMMDERPT